MEQFVLVGIILLFSIMEATARKKRDGGAQARPGSGPDSGTERPVLGAGDSALTHHVRRRPTQPTVQARKAALPDPAAHTRATPGDAIHKTHPDFGKRPVDRKSSVPALEMSVGRNEELTAVRRMFAGGAPALRRAVVLEEVLGPPAAMRGDPFDPVG